jgi:DNA mismatch endonuclease (patch repair protein)
MDVVDVSTRSRMMRAVKNSNTKPELIVRSLLHRAGLRFRLHAKPLPGRPDIVLTRHRAIVFVNGCFWHQHEHCPDGRLPKSNRRFWRKKLNANVVRDEIKCDQLKALGWRVFVVWECEVNSVSIGLLAAAIRDG